MKLRFIFWPLFSLVLVGTIGYLIGFKKSETRDADNKYIVKTYQIAPERIHKVEKAVKRLLSSVDGTVQLADKNLLFVSIPSHFRSGVDELVHQLSQPMTNYSSRVKMDYWVLLASNKPIVNSTTDLGSITEVVSSIDSIDGKQHYHVIEHLSSYSGAGKEVRVQGWLAYAKGRISLFDAQSMNIKFNFRSEFGDISSNTNIKNNEYAVLGQSAINPRTLKKVLGGLWRDELNIASNKVYYIIRPRIVE